MTITTILRLFFNYTYQLVKLLEMLNYKEAVNSIDDDDDDDVDDDYVSFCLNTNQ